MNGNLQLTRKPGQRICIGNDVTVTIARVRGNHVTVNVSAPKNVTVHREEIWHRIQQEQREQTA